MTVKETVAQRSDSLLSALGRDAGQPHEYGEVADDNASKPHSMNDLEKHIEVANGSHYSNLFLSMI